MELTAGGFERREILGLCGVLAVAGALPRPVLAQPRSEAFSDAHAHFFNLSDLPARGFLRHVLLPSGADRIGPVPALLDLVDKLQRLAISAQDELALEGDAPTVTSLELYSAAMHHIANGSARSNIGSPGLFGLARLMRRELELADSYGLLAAALRRIQGYAGGTEDDLKRVLGVREAGREDVIFGGDAEPIESKAVDRVLRLIKPGKPDCPEQPRGTGEVSLDFVREQMRWVHLMLQPRRKLVELYLKATGQKRRPAATVVNLLVDYDRWLADAPRQGSSQQDQIAFWTRCASEKHAAGKVDIRTFAGFDPLRHAEEREPGGSSPYLERLVAQFHARANPAADAAIHGFKLYPPMGFAPSGNVPWMFEGDTPVLTAVRARWAARFPDTRIHEALNDALDAFFARCAGEGIPVITHAFHSNEAGRCFGSRASPAGWGPVLERHPGLRVSLGHFADSADFLRAAKRQGKGRPLAPRMWPFTGTAPLLDKNRAGHGELFVDISYMSEFLLERKQKGRRQAAAFFSALKDYCHRHDPEARHIMFGTDWILLGREPHNHVYVQTIRAAMAEAGWPLSWQENLLHANLQRFLGPLPGQALA